MSLGHHPSSFPVKNLNLNLNHLQKTFKHPPGLQTLHRLNHLKHPPGLQTFHCLIQLHQPLQSPRLSPQSRIFDLHLVPTSFAHLGTISVALLYHNSHRLVVYQDLTESLFSKALYNLMKSISSLLFNSM